MNEKKMRHCMAFYGKIDTAEEDWRRFMAFALDVSEKTGKKVTHCSLVTNPLGPKGRGITTLRNIDNRVSRVYADEKSIAGFSFFSLPKEWNFAYKENCLYIIRSNFNCISLESTDGISDEMAEYLREEMPKHIDCVWGEEFLMENGRISLAYCMDQLEKNPEGHDPEHFFYDSMAVSGRALIPLRRFRADGTEVRFAGTPTLGRK